MRDEPEVKLRTLRRRAKVRSADSILDHSAKAIEIDDIEARISKLERRRKD